MATDLAGAQAVRSALSANMARVKRKEMAFTMRIASIMQNAALLIASTADTRPAAPLPPSRKHCSGFVPP